MRERKIIRLQGFNYSNAGYYFVTICIDKWESVFCSVGNRLIILNEYGKIAHNCWLELPKHFPYCEIDEFVVMPNHVHGIIHICDTIGVKQKPQYQKLPVIIGSYKSAVTKLIHQSGLMDFKWQRSYNDKIIRNETELNIIKNYIRNNPKKLLQMD